MWSEQLKEKHLFQWWQQESNPCRELCAAVKLSLSHLSDKADLYLLLCYTFITGQPLKSEKVHAGGA